MKTKLSGKIWTALVLFSLIGQVAWVVENMYLNVFIYKMFHASAGDISLMVAASAVAATLTTIIMGALSDKVGKRRIFMALGYILWGISIIGFAFLRTDWLKLLLPAAASGAALGISLTIILDCVMTFFGSTANDAAYNAWLTDVTDPTNRGSAEGVNSMMPLVSVLVVFGGFMAFDLDKPESWTAIFVIVGAVVLVVGILGFFLIDDSRTVRSEMNYGQNLIYSFRPATIKANKNLYEALLGFILFNIAIQIFMPYLIIYYEVSLQLSNYVLIMAPAIIIAAVATVFCGKMYDKRGFQFSIVTALVGMILGFALLYLFKNVIIVFIGSMLMLGGYLSGMAVFGARIRDLTPEGMAGRFQGARIFSQVLIPGVVGPYIGKAVLSGAETILNNDGTTSFVPNSLIFLAAMAVTGLLLILILIRTKVIKSEKRKKAA